MSRDSEDVGEPAAVVLTHHATDSGLESGSVVQAGIDDEVDFATKPQLA